MALIQLKFQIIIQVGPLYATYHEYMFIAALVFQNLLYCAHSQFSKPTYSLHGGTHHSGKPRPVTRSKPCCGLHWLVCQLKSVFCAIKVETAKTSLRSKIVNFSISFPHIVK